MADASEGATRLFASRAIGMVVLGCRAPRPMSVSTGPSRDASGRPNASKGEERFGLGVDVVVDRAAKAKPRPRLHDAMRDERRSRNESHASELSRRTARGLNRRARPMEDALRHSRREVEAREFVGLEMGALLDGGELVVEIGRRFERAGERAEHRGAAAARGAIVKFRRRFHVILNAPALVRSRPR